MKVLVVAHYFQPHTGGIEVVAQNQARYLSKAGHRVQILTSAVEKQPAGIEKHPDGYTIYRVRASNILERKLGVPFPVFSPSIFMRSYKLIKSADVVHVHDAFYISSLVTTLFARIYNKPVILTQHVAMIPHPKKSINVIQRIVYATTGSFIFHASAKIIILNSRVRNFLLDKGVAEGKIIFLPNGVDTKQFHPASEKEKSLLRKKYKLSNDRVLALFVGRFVPKKGFTKLLQMKPITNLTVVFAGGYAPLQHKQHNHHFLGPVTREDIADVFRMCDIFVLPSEGEGFPLTVQEAMACGLTIVTTNDPAYALYNLDPDHIYFVSPNIAEFRRVLEEISIHPEKRRATHKYVRNYAVSHFNWSAYVDSVTKLYEEVTA